MMANISESRSNFAYLKNGSSVSLLGHCTDGTDMLPARSERLLKSRGPCYPVLSLDLSVEHANETHHRRRLHKDLVLNDPGVFRRKAQSEGTNHVIKIKQLSRDLMEGMHSLKDPKDLDKAKTSRLSYSRLPDTRKEDEEIKFKNMLPLEDFNRPDNLTEDRTTGFTPGHIRSMLQLDTYGPAHSVKVNTQRQMGVLPQSPNVDRYALLNQQHLETGSLGGDEDSLLSRATMSRGGRSGTSRASTVDSTYYNSLEHEANRIATGSTFSKANQNVLTSRDFFHHTSNVIPDGHMFGTPLSSVRGSTARPGTLGYHGRAITIEDQALKDPFLKSKMYYQMFSIQQKEKVERRKAVEKKRQHEKKQRELAEKERKAVSEFERYVVLAKLEP